MSNANSSEYSALNICPKISLRACLSNLSRRCKKSSRARCGLAAMLAAISSADKPNAFKPSLKSFVPILALCNLDNNALIAVPASSGDLPKLTKVAANAAASSLSKPNCLALPPIRINTSPISFSLAAVVLPSALMASPNSAISLICKPYTLLILADISPAASALMPKAFAICAVIWVNCGSLSNAKPICPPAAAICANSSGIMPNCPAISLRLPESALICSGVASVTFLTCAIALSNLIASLVTYAKPPPAPTKP